MKLLKRGPILVILFWAVSAVAQGRDDIVKYGSERERSFLDGCYVALILEGWSKKSAQAGCMCSAVFYSKMKGYEPGSSALTGERSYTVEANLGTQRCFNLQRESVGANTGSDSNDRSLDGGINPDLREQARQSAIAGRKERERQKAEDKKWWSENQKDALSQRRKISKCVLDNIGKASSSRAVNEVRNTCRELNWREDWPKKYIDQNPME